MRQYQTIGMLVVTVLATALYRLGLTTLAVSLVSINYHKKGVKYVSNI